MFRLTSNSRCTFCLIKSSEYKDWKQPYSLLFYSVHCCLHRRHLTRAIPRYFAIMWYFSAFLLGTLWLTFSPVLFPASLSWTQVSWNLYALVSSKFPASWKMYVYILADERMIFCVDFRTRWDTCKMTTIVYSRAKAVKDSIDLALINFLQCELDKLIASASKNAHFLSSYDISAKEALSWKLTSKLSC